MPSDGSRPLSEIIGQRILVGHSRALLGASEADPFYRKIPVTVEGDELHVPSFEIPAVGDTERRFGFSGSQGWRVPSDDRP